MRSSVQLTLFLSALVTLAIVHTVAMQFFLYWKYVWLDMPVHVLGGMTVAFGLTLLPRLSARVPWRFTSVISVLLGVLVVGALWEVFEWSIGFRVGNDVWAIDLALDMLMDAVGATLGFGIMRGLSNV